MPVSKTFSPPSGYRLPLHCFHGSHGHARSCSDGPGCQPVGCSWSRSFTGDPGSSLLLIEHITSINAPRLCIMHNPCCPVLLEAVLCPLSAQASNTRKFSCWLLPPVSCRPQQCLLFNQFYIALLYLKSFHPGLAIVRVYSRPGDAHFFLVAPRILHLADCAQFHVPGRDL